MRPPLLLVPVVWISTTPSLGASPAPRVAIPASPLPCTAALPVIPAAVRRSTADLVLRRAALVELPACPLEVPVRFLLLRSTGVPSIVDLLVRGDAVVLRIADGVGRSADGVIASATVLVGTDAGLAPIAVGLAGIAFRLVLIARGLAAGVYLLASRGAVLASRDDLLSWTSNAVVLRDDARAPPNVIVKPPRKALTWRRRMLVLQARRLRRGFYPLARIDALANCIAHEKQDDMFFMVTSNWGTPPAAAGGALRKSCPPIELLPKRRKWFETVRTRLNGFER